MGILDEAIREHLELKRQHGADDSELSKLEDEAFGQAERPGDEAASPDPLAEAPTEFMAQPDVAEAPSPRRETSIADLQEPPPPPAEEQPAMEHEVVVDAPQDAEPAEAESPPEPEAAGPTTEERHAIAEQPTELHDVEEELAAEGPPNPTDEDLVEEEIAEPRLAPADPLAGLEEDEEAEVTVTGPAPDDDDDFDDEDDAFWNEQRLSDELDQALEAPREADAGAEAEEDIEVIEEGADADVDEEHDDEVEEDEPEYEDEPSSEAEQDPEATREHEAPAARHEEDVLEETPDFLEETPEDDQLWFEQKPPKDFDFDD